jgi:predicted TIM-barrel fold metal-dependent hydrolase
MDATERRLQRAAQITKNKEQGAAWEDLIKETLSDKLKYNFERGQLFGGRKPDFAVYNDDGEQMAFVEAKSHTQANAHDFEQTIEAIEQASQYPGCEMVIVTPNGPDFFTKEQTEQIEHAASTGANKVNVSVVDFPQWEQIASRFERAAATSPAPPAAAAPVVPTPAAAPALPPTGPLQPQGRG